MADARSNSPQSKRKSSTARSRKSRPCGADVCTPKAKVQHLAFVPEDWLNRVALPLRPVDLAVMRFVRRLEQDDAAKALALAQQNPAAAARVYLAEGLDLSEARAVLCALGLMKGGA